MPTLPPEPVYIVGPAVNINQLAGALIRRSLADTDGDTVAVVEPLYERAGVLNRRGCIAYRWTGAEVARIAMRLGVLGITTLNFRDDPPANWRGSLV